MADNQESVESSVISRRNVLRFAVTAPAALAFTACSSSVATSNQAGDAPRSASLESMEQHFGHKLATPAGSLGAKLIESSFLKDEGISATFAGEAAVLVYEWRSFRLAILQGRPAKGWTVRAAVSRPDASFEKGVGGVEFAILPGTAKSAPLAFRAQKDWVVKVEAPPAPGISNGSLAVKELSAFVRALSL